MIVFPNFLFVSNYILLCLWLLAIRGATEKNYFTFQ